MGKKSKTKSRNTKGGVKDKKNQKNGLDSVQGEDALGALLASVETSERYKKMSDLEKIKNEKVVERLRKSGDVEGLLNFLCSEIADAEDASKDEVAIHKAWNGLIAYHIQKKLKKSMVDVYNFPEEIRGITVEESFVFPSGSKGHKLRKKPYPRSDFISKFKKVDGDLIDTFTEKMKLTIALYGQNVSTVRELHELEEKVIQESLDKTKVAMLEHNVYQVGQSPSILPFLLMKRAEIRCKMAIHPTEETEVLTLAQSVIQDTTEAIRLVVQMLEETSGNSFLYSNTAFKALKMRGDTLGAFEELPSAAADYKIVATTLRAVTKFAPADDAGKDMYARVSEDLVLTLCRIKIQDTQNRPVLNRLELQNLQKDLGFGAYSDENYVCAHCEAPSFKENLFLCRTCEETWYCSKECQANHWKLSHKQECPTLNAKPIELLVTCHELEMIKEHVSSSYGAYASQLSDGFICMAVDNHTGLCYDVLSGKKIDFCLVDMAQVDYSYDGDEESNGFELSIEEIPEEDDGEEQKAIIEEIPEEDSEEQKAAESAWLAIQDLD